MKDIKVLGIDLAKIENRGQGIGVKNSFDII